MKHFTIRAITLCLSSAFCQLAVADEAKPPEDKATLELKEVVVSATRTEQDVNDVAATVTTISSERIEREMPTDLEDLLRYETGVSVRAQSNRPSAVFRNAGRGGNEGINIRGLEGNQVLLQVDGVRLPQSYSSGPYQAGRGDYIDVEAYKRVELLRGPSSTQFGSDGLSGTVSFVTKDPTDLLTLGKPTQAAAKLGYNSADRSWVLVPSFAARGDTVEAMVLASIRQGHETENMGANSARHVSRTAPNPADNKSDYLLAKLVAKPSAAHEVKFTLERLDRNTKSDVLSFFGDTGAHPNLTNENVAGDITRDMYKLDWSYKDADNPFFQIANAAIYHQDSLNRQYGSEIASAPSGATLWTYRTRDTWYDEKTLGGNLQFESNLGEAVTHRLIYGFDTSLTKYTSLKDGFNDAGAAFPVNKSAPDTEHSVFGAFIQDEIGIGNVSVIPGLRYDSFKITPKLDALYANPASLSTLKKDHLSPKLGVIWKLAPLANPYAQYAHGFRAPHPSQLNGGVTNLNVTTGGSGNYTSVGNPDLKPETSDSIELGIRGNNDALRYSANVFRSKYKNFIESNVTVESHTHPIPDVLMSVNRGSVEISGFELRGDWAFRRNWTLSGSYAHTKGDTIANGVSTPLDTIDPDKLVLGLRYDEENRFGGQAMLTVVEKKSNPKPANFSPVGHQLVDLAGWYHFDKQTSVNVGVNNLFDKKYFEWADVRDVTANYAAIDAYSQPGRNFSLSVKHQF